MAPRRIVADAKFKRAMERLGSPNAAALVRRVARQLANKPHSAPALDGADVRVLRTRSYAGYPALRLFYTFDAHAVYLLDVQQYDELTASVEGA